MLEHFYYPTDNQFILDSRAVGFALGCYQDFLIEQMENFFVDLAKDTSGIIDSKKKPF